MKVLQLRDDTPNPITNLSGYEPTTDYWQKAIRMVNTMLESQAQFEVNNGYAVDKKVVKASVDMLIEEEIFPDELPHTAVEWAEFVMSLNHVLWALDSAPRDKEVVVAMEIMNDLYYKWHDKALDRLKEDDLSTYLRITD